MGIDISLSKNYGFSVPLTSVSDSYWELTEELDTFSAEHGNALTYDTSGSFSMTGAREPDVFIVGLSRLYEYEYPKESSGVAWTFHELPTPEEVALLLEVAKKFFDLDNPILEHIVALSYS